MNLSDYRLEDLYHPELANVLSIVQYWFFAISSIIIFFTGYVIFTKSTIEMKHYKYIMFTQIFWGYLLDFVLQGRGRFFSDF